MIELLELVLTNNIFEFDEQLYKQLIGTAMGSKPAPDYANIFMSVIDDEILKLSDKIKLFKRFLDDIYMVFKGNYDDLHSLLEEINEIHPNIKFTIEHTKGFNTEEEHCKHCDKTLSDSLPFLDTHTKIHEKKILVDLYKKPTDKNMYLLTSSAHPTHTFKNIPFSLALRIVRICSLPEVRDQRLEELKNLLISREYKPGIIDAAIMRAKAIPRSEAIKRVERKTNTNRVVFAVKYDPRLPSVTNIVRKHWRTMTQDPYMKEVFENPPLVAYKRNQNLRDLLIKAKVPKKQRRPQRNLPGMYKCNNCPICPYIKTDKLIKAHSSDCKVELTKRYTCQSKNLVYVISCSKCGLQYVGETEKSLQTRFSQHLGYVRNDHLKKATGQHFNLPGHSLDNMKVSVIETINNKSEFYRKNREKHYIEKLNTKYKGLNRNQKR